MYICLTFNLARGFESHLIQPAVTGGKNVARQGLVRNRGKGRDIHKQDDSGASTRHDTSGNAAVSLVESPLDHNCNFYRLMLTTFSKGFL